MDIFYTRINLTFVTKRLLKKLHVKVSSATCNTCLQDHPEYPGLLALSDCLTEWKVENNAYRINKKKYNSNDLLFPFVAHLPENGGRFILVNSLKDKIYSYTDELHNNGKLTEADFLNRWEGIALHPRATAKSGEDNFRSNRLKSQLQKCLYPLGCLILGLGISLSDRAFAWPLLSLTFIKI